MSKSYGDESRDSYRQQRHDRLTERFRERFDDAQAALVERDVRTLARQTLAAARLVSVVDGRADVRTAAAQVTGYGYHPNALAFLETVARSVQVATDDGVYWRAAVEIAGGPDAALERFRRALATVETVGVYDDHLPSNVGERTYVIGEDFGDSPLQQMYEKRERQGRSLQGIIVARDNATGTGKTTLAVSLCQKWADDWTAENATNRPSEYRDFLNNKPEGSVLLADEIGQMYDSRRSMSNENVEVSQDWQMIRTKRYKTLSTLPGPSFLDKRLKKLADVLIVCTRRGHARVYRVKVDDETGDLWREHLHNVEWSALDDDPEYQRIEEMKRERLAERFAGDDADDELTERDIEAAQRRTRDGIVADVYADTSLTQQEIADATGLSRSRVGDIVSSD